MEMRALMLSCGYFPDNMLALVDQRAWDCFAHIKYGDRPALVVCDFPVFGLSHSWHYTVPDELVGTAYWEGFSSDRDYYEALIHPGDEVNSFCLARDPAHRDILSLMNRICVDCGVPQLLHLF